jgi:cytoskeleton protein RodZ
MTGDIYRVPNRTDETLDTGNAGGLEIRDDGKLIPALGDAGVVVRHVSLAPDALLAR